MFRAFGQLTLKGLRVFMEPPVKGDDDNIPNENIICISYNCATENNLAGLRFAATYNTLNDPRNPTSGNFFSFGTEQFLSVGENSPTFNRVKASYTQFFPVNWLKIAKGCRPKPGEKENCPQAIGIQLKAGSIVGDLLPMKLFAWVVRIQCVVGTTAI